MVSHLLPPHHGVTLVTELNQGVESWFDEGEGESSTTEILFRQIWCSSSRFKSFTFQVSLLSHLLVLSSPPDCPAPPLTLSACPRSQPYLSHPVIKVVKFSIAVLDLRLVQSLRLPPTQVLSTLKKDPASQKPKYLWHNLPKCPSTTQRPTWLVCPHAPSTPSASRLLPRCTWRKS